jgi:hypothetical protein
LLPSPPSLPSPVDPLVDVDAGDDVAVAERLDRLAETEERDAATEDAEAAEEAEAMDEATEAAKVVSAKIVQQTKLKSKKKGVI